MNDPAFEPHYTLPDLCKMWGYGRDTIRKWIKGEPGILIIRGPRGRATYSVPESVARRIHLKRTARPQ